MSNIVVDKEKIIEDQRSIVYMLPKEICKNIDVKTGNDPSCFEILYDSNNQYDFINLKLKKINAILEYNWYIDQYGDKAHIRIESYSSMYFEKKGS